MKNKSIENMVITQYNWDSRDVDIEFVDKVNGEYTFKVRHKNTYDQDPPVNLKISVKVEEL